MSAPFSFNTIIVVLIDLLGFSLAFWVYWADRSGKVNRGFSLMVVFILAWVTFYHLATVSAQHELSIFWFRLATASVFAFFIAYYFFIVRWFLEKKGWYSLGGFFILAYGIVFGSLAAETDIFIADLEVINLFIIPAFHPFGWWAFYGFVIFLTLFINWVLVTAYFKYPKENKSKIQYFLTGLLLFAGLNFIFNVILPVFFNIYKFYELGNYSAIFLIGLTAYAIVKRELFGIRVVLTALFITLIAVLLLLDIVLFTPLLLMKLYKGLVVTLFLYLGYLLIQSVQREIRYREQLQQAYEELQKLDKAKSEFLSIASHQLRTPLTAIKGYISMMLEGTYGELTEKQRKPVVNVYRSNERLIELINNLLDISRIEAGKMEMKWEQASLEDIVQGVVEELQVKVQERELQLIFEKPEEEIPLVRLDQEKIRNAVLNIIDNGIRYTHQGSVTARLKLQGSAIQIEISDTGEGMEREEVEKIFESFSRGAAGTRLWTEGAGLGLYIAKQFVLMHGGKIWVESEGKGRGTTFYIELPIT